MACSTCDGYEFVPNPADPALPHLDCPDCRAIDARPRVWCPVHSVRVEEDGSCRRCTVEAAQGIARILGDRAAEVASVEGAATA